MTPAKQEGPNPEIRRIMGTRAKQAAGLRKKLDRTPANHPAHNELQGRITRLLYLNEICRGRAATMC